nr:MAG TPA: hypothetical protein [Caudoviricetes sp.]
MNILIDLPNFVKKSKNMKILLGTELQPVTL